MDPTEASAGKKAISYLQSLFSGSSLDRSQHKPGVASVFSYKELKKATKNFKTQIGQGGYGTVYIGQLEDKRTVAVKMILDRSERVVKQFNNEVDLLSRLRHRNLIEFYGATNPFTKAHKPMLLVYEYVPNRTVAYHLHDQHDQPFVLPLRIRIAIELAEVLAYLHSENPPIVHRDIKTDNILLDKDFRVKVADFGLCRLVTSDNKDVLTVTPGTAGYQDPECQGVFRVTDKSDVYSFGVVLIELISRKKAVDVYRGPDKVFLDKIALSQIRNKELDQLVDPNIGYYSDENVKRSIDCVIELAIKCMRPTGVERPSMVEVLELLKEIPIEMQDPEISKTMKQKMPEKEGKNDFLSSFFKRKKRADHEETQEMMFVPDHEENQQMMFGLAHVFSYEELKEATNMFDAAQLLGNGGFGRTYLGKLRDGRMVAVKVKVLYWNNPNRLEQFFNEVTVLSRIRHQNLETLHGCTNRSSRELLLVYEFVPNGSVADHLHGKRPSLPWMRRMQIAIQTAEALMYLHSREPPIIHRDVKTANILLDNAFNAKVADVGMSSLLPWDTTQIWAAPQGTMGYRAPENERSNRSSDMADVGMSSLLPWDTTQIWAAPQGTLGYRAPEDYPIFRLSDRSDVYSFGVVLIELISGQQAVDVHRDPDDIYLDTMALRKISNRELEQLVDRELGYESNSEIKRMVDSVVELACRCLQSEGKLRPAMVEVVTDLKRISEESAS